MQVIEKITNNLGSMQFDSDEEYLHFFANLKYAGSFKQYRINQIKEGRVVAMQGRLLSPSVYEYITIYSSLEAFKYFVARRLQSYNFD